MIERFAKILKGLSLQTQHVYSTLKRRGNDRFHVVSMWNKRGVFVALVVNYFRKTSHL